jgi:hypothetical protein
VNVIIHDSNRNLLKGHGVHLARKRLGFVTFCSAPGSGLDDVGPLAIDRSAELEFRHFVQRLAGRDIPGRKIGVMDRI